MNELELYRERIDRIDDELVALLAKRMELVALIGKYKRTEHLAAYDANRWSTVLTARINLGESLGLSRAFVAELYELIHRHALELENSIDFCAERPR